MLLALLLLSLFLLILLGFYVFVGAPRNRTHQTFAAFVACLAVWTVKDIAFWGFLSEREGAAAWWAASSFIIALALQYPLIAFAWVFPEDREFPLRRRAAVLFAPGAIFVPAIIAGWMWNEIRFTGGRFTAELTPLAYAFGLYTYILFGYGCALLARKYRLYRSTLRGQQLGAILWGLAITGVLNTTANIALPLAGVYSWLPFGSILLLPGVMIYAYAISNFKLFSLSTALDQFRLFPIAYKVALIIAIIAVSSFLLLQIPIVYWSFGAVDFRTEAGAEAWRRYLVFSVVAALLPNLLLLALVIRTLSRPVRRVTEAAVRVAGGEYGAEVAVTSNDEVGLLARSFNEMSRKMRADIEELQKMNEHLIRAERLAAAGTLAAGVAHEVNNPLASISSLIQILQARSDTSAEAREMLRLISTQVERITQVTREMMNFASERAPVRASVNITDALKASIRLASFDKNFKRLHLTETFDESVPLIFADPDALEQVFLNLLLNARDAMPDGGSLRIKTRFVQDKNEIRIEIADTGCGISSENASRAFDPFFTTKSPGANAGLGLSVCHRIITAHDGRIELSANDERGTRVHITLPVEFPPRQFVA
jgi:signal transduction histidine kinase